jgi:anti-sigma factor RsiW
MCPHEPLIDDYVDGALEPSVRTVFEAHLGHCESCSALVADFRAIRSAAAVLDQQPVPPRVWTRIEASLHHDRAAVDPVSRIRHWLAGLGVTGWVPAAAAASLLIVAIGVWALRTPANVPGPRPGAGVAGDPVSGPVDPEFAVAEAHYETAIADLQQIASDSRATLDAQTSAVLDSNLSVIDHAIDESRAALTEQPADDTARESLFDALRSKVVLLQETVALINEMRKGDQDGVARVISGLNQ